tara:strand:- start:184 stop:417 length:234 start_codon:yes stop_codon:yes gene_type:complete
MQEINIKIDRKDTKKSVCREFTTYYFSSLGRAFLSNHINIKYANKFFFIKRNPTKNLITVYLLQFFENPPLALRKNL